MGLTILAVIVFVILAVIVFMNFSPQFGKGPSRAQLVAYAQADNHNGSNFENQLTTTVGTPGLTVMWEFIKGSKDRSPARNIDVLSLDSTALEKSKLDTTTQLTWFGHSAFLMQMDGQNILLDPMFGPTPAPHPKFGTKRYSENLPIEIDQLPVIDAVIISHDHYDHLDYGSIKKLKDKTERFFVPLGVGNHLRFWGVEDHKIEELNWHDESGFAGIRLVATPARHFSGRGITDRNATLWCSWVIEGENDKVFFSGDGGYGPHFKEIGQEYGPFDISLMECGQYNENWHLIHMMPEETAQAAQDVGSKLMMPIHWGAFTLALHSWTDPAERVRKAAEKLGVPITTPRIGETLVVGSDTPPQTEWWYEYTLMPKLKGD